MVSIYDNFEDIKEIWIELYSHGENTVFQSWDYNRISWSSKGGGIKGTLWIIAYKDNVGKIRAILPTYIDVKATLRFINDNGTDICNGVFDPAFPLYDGMKEIVSFISGQSAIKYISLENIPYSSIILSYFKIFLSKSFVYSNNEVSFITCRHSEDVISTFTHLTSEKRKKLKRIIKQTAGYPFQIYSYLNKDEFPFESLKTIADEMVRSQMRHQAYFDHNFWNFVECAYNAGLLEVALLKDSDNNPISAGFVFSDGKTAIRWVILYKDVKYNLWNNVRYIVEKSNHQTYINNFGRGGYDYKMGNFKPQIELLYKVISPNGKSGGYRQLKEIIIYLLKRNLKLSPLRTPLLRIGSLLKYSSSKNEF